MFRRISTAIKVPACIAVLVVGICVVGVALRKTQSQVHALAAADAVSGEKADFATWDCLEQRLDSLIPTGAQVFDADTQDLYKQRILEFASARYTIVPLPSQVTWSASVTNGIACAPLDVSVVGPSIAGSP